MPISSQLGVRDEGGVYGTQAGAVNRFFEFNSENIRAVRPRVESPAMRANQRVQRSDRFVPTNMGAAGPIELPVLTKGFGWWLRYMLGTTATAGPTDSVYTHTGTIGDLTGDSFTMQVDRGFYGGSSQPFTWEGGKIASWTLRCDVDGLLLFNADLDFEDETRLTALASASYESAMQPLSWAGGAVTVEGTSVPVTTASFGCNNGLKTDRRYLRGSTLKKEPVEAAHRDISWNLAADFDSLTQYNRFTSDTAAGALATIVATWTGPVLAGAAAYPQLIVTIEEARFDDVDGIGVTSTEPLSQALSGRGLFDGTNSAIKVEYKSVDATA